MKLPKKKYLTFDELVAKWNCTKGDLFYFVLNGELIPSIVISGLFDQNRAYPFQEDEDMYYTTVEKSDCHCNGLFYLQGRKQLDHLTCSFSSFSSNRFQDFFEIGYELETNIYLTKKVNSNDIEGSSRIVFCSEEITNFEILHGDEKESDDASKGENKFEMHDPTDQKLLSSRERNNLYKIVAALCSECGLSLEKPHKAAQIIQNKIEELNLRLSAETIAKVLEKAEQTRKFGK